ncbi:MAG: beta-ureidopropionase [Armatimonadetes bacterium]|nr:beta-ureidopropionase [Armatimonadota bacterium]
MSFRLASVQFRPDMGRISHNLDRMAEIVRQAVSEESASLVVFPETAVSGYYVEGGAVENALSSDELLGELSGRLSGVDVDLLVGFYEKADGQPFNSAGYFEFSSSGARTVGVYHKFFLPTYTVFDEDRYVARGVELGLFDTRLGTVGVLICEDAWHSVLGTLLALRGAQLICTIVASPARGFQGSEPSNVERYERMVRAMAEEHGVFAASAMLTGFEGGKGLVGGSVVFDPHGVRLAKGEVMEEHMVVAEIDLDMVEIARAKAPLLADLRGSWETILSLAKE